MCQVWVRAGSKIRIGIRIGSCIPATGLIKIEFDCLNLTGVMNGRRKARLGIALAFDGHMLWS